MPSSMTLSLPPFTRAIKVLIAVYAGIYVLLIVLGAVGQRILAGQIYGFLVLRPYDVVHGKIYELVTYGFLSSGFWDFLFSMLMLWMFGSMLEVAWGSRKFWEFYLFGIVGAAVGTVILAYGLKTIIHLNSESPAFGAWGAIYAILMATAMLFGDQEVYMFPLPISIRLKYLVGILAFIALVSALASSGSANIAQLSGLLFGWIYVKFVPRRGMLFAFSETSYSLRNRYHRWQRRRAGRKFQVYMKKHGQDPKDYFDEYGNFRPPDDKPKGNGGSKGGWVN
ncbi:MAG TPA: rhomboid family intramembrane serine protease [Candidatus Angelobacter sp.]|nr:rhomboid family intramembrane serine protease [Candidatus Angelobacter sp.]